MKVNKASNKTEYQKIKALKKEMSQEFNGESALVPFTSLVIEKTDVEVFKTLDENTRLMIEGTSKGKGTAGTIKRWGFRAGPNTHGQVKARHGGSIGTQGQGRVIPGKKMAGKMGNQKVTLVTKFLGFDEKSLLVKVKGGIPGSRNSKVIIYVFKPKE